jgi:hypothetical protein
MIRYFQGLYIRPKLLLKDRKLMRNIYHIQRQNHSEKRPGSS